MGRACSTNGLLVGVRQNSINSIKIESMDWIYLAQDRNQWRALVNTVMNFKVP
jgi:hypothetical protein